MFKTILFALLSFSLSLHGNLQIGVENLPTNNAYKSPEDFYYISKQQRKEVVDDLIVGVFDGHGMSGPGMRDGFRVAKHAQERIEKSIHEATDKCKDTELALKIAFEDLERNIPERDRCAFCGSTAIVGFIKDRNLYIANSGDSQALVVLKSGTKIFTTQHKAVPGTAEGDRIMRYNGTIHCMYAFDLNDQEYILSKRINYASKPPIIEWFDEDLKGNADSNIVELAEHKLEMLKNLSQDWFICVEDDFQISRLGMSRSLGDFAFKNVGLISEPDIYKFSLDEIDYVFFASDGLWNGLNPDMVTQYVFTERTSQTPSQICKELVSLARKNGSTDDITIIGLFF